VEPFYQPTSLLDEVERMARDILASRPVTAISTNLTPRMDMHENKQGLVIKAEFPGIKKGDLDIDLEDGVLSIKVEKKAEDTTFYSCERHFGQYSRRILLPFHIDPEQISAILKADLSEIKPPPKTEEVNGKHIEVKVRSYSGGKRLEIDPPHSDLLNLSISERCI
jgi:HSP20 family protein